jgi:hypothetical protein
MQHQVHTKYENDDDIFKLTPSEENFKYMQQNKNKRLNNENNNYNTSKQINVPVKKQKNINYYKTCCYDCYYKQPYIFPK